MATLISDVAVAATFASFLSRVDSLVFRYHPLPVNVLARAPADDNRHSHLYYRGAFGFPLEEYRVYQGGIGACFHQLRAQPSWLEITKGVKVPLAALHKALALHEARHRFQTTAQCCPYTPTNAPGVLRQMGWCIFPPELTLKDPLYAAREYDATVITWVALSILSKKDLPIGSSTLIELVTSSPATLQKIVKS